MASSVGSLDCEQRASVVPRSCSVGDVKGKGAYNVRGESGPQRIESVVQGECIL